MSVLNSGGGKLGGGVGYFTGTTLVLCWIFCQMATSRMVEIVPAGVRGEFKDHSDQ